MTRSAARHAPIAPNQSPTTNRSGVNDHRRECDRAATDAHDSSSGCSAVTVGDSTASVGDGAGSFAGCGAAGASGGGGGGGGGVVSIEAREAPHFWQNFAPDGVVAQQFGQSMSGPHSTDHQNAAYLLTPTVRSVYTKNPEDPTRKRGHFVP
jgi:hypothetical protein